MLNINLIRSTEKDALDGTDLYWSNGLGWVNIEFADVFTHADLSDFLLPDGGEWVYFQQTTSPV